MPELTEGEVPYVREMHAWSSKLGMHIASLSERDELAEGFRLDMEGSYHFVALVQQQLGEIYKGLSELAGLLSTLRELAERFLAQDRYAATAGQITYNSVTIAGGIVEVTQEEYRALLAQKQDLLAGVAALYDALTEVHKAHNHHINMDEQFYKVENFMKALEEDIEMLENKDEEKRQRREREEAERRDREERERRARQEQEEREERERERQEQEERERLEREEEEERERLEREERERLEQEERERQQKIRADPEQWQLHKFEKKGDSYEVVPCDGIDDEASVFVKWSPGEVEAWQLSADIAGNTDRLDGFSKYHDAIVHSNVLHLRSPGLFPEFPVKFYLVLRNLDDRDDDDYECPTLLSLRSGPRTPRTITLWMPEPVSITTIDGYDVAEFDVSQLVSASYVVLSPPTEEARRNLGDVDSWPVYSYKDKRDIICLARARRGTIEERDLTCRRYEWNSPLLADLGGSYVATHGEDILSDIVQVENQSVFNRMGDFITNGKKRHILLSFPCTRPNDNNPVVHMSEDLKEWTALDTSTPTIPGFKDLYVGEVKRFHLKHSFFVVTSDFDRDFDNVPEHPVSPKGGEFFIKPDVKITVPKNTMIGDAKLKSKMRSIPPSHATIISRNNNDGVHAAGPVLDIVLAGQKVEDGHIRVEMSRPLILPQFRDNKDKDKMYLVLKIHGTWVAWSLMSGKDDNMVVNGKRVAFDASAYSESLMIIQGPATLAAPMLANTAAELDRATRMKAVCVVVMVRGPPAEHAVYVAAVPHNRAKAAVSDASENGFYLGPGKVKEFLAYDGEIFVLRWIGDIRFNDCDRLSIIYREQGGIEKYIKTISPNKSDVKKCHAILQLVQKNSGEVLCECDININMN